MGVRRILGAAGFLAGAVILSAVVVGCGTDGLVVSATPPLRADPPAGAGGEVRLPPASAQVDYQLGGSYPPPPGVTVVARDSAEMPAAGLYNVCYINGFQTQPGQRARWQSLAGDLVLTDDDGPVADPNWPNEFLLDTSSSLKRHAIDTALAATILHCADRGFDAVEFDNLDSFARSDGALAASDNLELARLLVERAHAHGLAAAQKNAAELGDRGRDVAGYDFVVTEQCAQYDECADYAAVYGARVIDIEYLDDLAQPFDELCGQSSRAASTILRDRLLTAPGDAGYHYSACPVQ